MKPVALMTFVLARLRSARKVPADIGIAMRTSVPETLEELAEVLKTAPEQVRAPSSFDGLGLSEKAYIYTMSDDWNEVSVVADNGKVEIVWEVC